MFEGKQGDLLQRQGIVMPSNAAVLVLAPVGRDAKIAASILATNEMFAHAARNLEEACRCWTGRSVW